MKNTANQYVICGIGTGVGKTLASAIVVRALGAIYWKPIQTGFLSGNGDSDTLEVKRLSACKTLPEAYLLDQPLSPHAAAQLEGVKIDIEQLKIPETNLPMVIEAAGGLMVPLNYEYLFIDLLQSWNIPVILTVRHYLGNINHTLLSIEALRSRNIPIAGLILIGDALPHTIEAIQAFGKVDVLLQIPELLEINSTVVEDYAATLRKKLV